MSPFIVALLVMLMAKPVLSCLSRQRKLIASARVIVGADICRYLRGRRPFASGSNERLKRTGALKDQAGSDLLLVAQLRYAYARASGAGIRIDIDPTRVSAPWRAATEARAATLGFAR
jgi:hypothetical protein